MFSMDGVRTGMAFGAITSLSVASKEWQIISLQGGRPAGHRIQLLSGVNST